MKVHRSVRTCASNVYQPLADACPMRRSFVCRGELGHWTPADRDYIAEARACRPGLRALDRLIWLRCGTAQELRSGSCKTVSYRLQQSCAQAELVGLGNLHDNRMSIFPAERLR